VPDERGPEAARVRSVSFRPRGPLSLRYQEHPHDGVPYLSEMPLMYQNRNAYESGCGLGADIAGLNHAHSEGRFVAVYLQAQRFARHDTDRHGRG
jgi:hypothetical protein